MFLQRDLHLTSAGHAVVAGVLAEELARPLFQHPGPGIPEGRSRVPVWEEFVGAGENMVHGSTQNRCQTYLVREWFFMHCRGTEDDQVTGAALLNAPQETFGTINKYSGLKIYMPVFAGRDADIAVLWSSRQEVLQVRWPADSAEADFRFAPLPERPPSAPTEHRQFGSSLGCDPVYICSRGSREQLPLCSPAEANAGSAGHCLKLCSESVPCEKGICSDWQGGRVCL